MKIIQTVGILALILAPSIAAAGNHSNSPGKNGGSTWGDLTSESVTSGFDQGAHSADPKGEGIGAEDPDKKDDRVGLANATGERGDMRATIEFIEGLCDADPGSCSGD